MPSSFVQSYWLIAYLIALIGGGMKLSTRIITYVIFFSGYAVLSLIYLCLVASVLCFFSKRFNLSLILSYGAFLLSTIGTLISIQRFWEAKGSSHSPGDMGVIVFRWDNPWNYIVIMMEILALVGQSVYVWVV